MQLGGVHRDGPFSSFRRIPFSRLLRKYILYVLMRSDMDNQPQTMLKGMLIARGHSNPASVIIRSIRPAAPVILASA